MNWLQKSLLPLIPGIIALFVIGIIAWFIGEQIPYISYLLVCIVFGMILSNIVGLPKIFEKGIKYTHKIFLESGIMVLGARILFVELLAIGPTLLALVLFFLLFSLTSIQYLSYRFGLEARFGSTLASGVAVCGVSAVIATGGGMQIKAKDMAYAIAAVLVCDIFAVFMWPFLGEVFSIPSQVFGPWAGFTSLSTGTAVAIGLMHSDHAGELATVVKMARNATIGVWALMFTVYYANKGLAQEVSNKGAYLWDKFPKFVLGVILIMILANLGFLTEAEIDSMTNAYSWLFMMAFVGLGYDINFKDLKQTGLKPLLITTAVFIIISVVSITLLYALMT